MKESEILSNIAAKLGFADLNPMQKTMAENYNTRDVVLLSPTGSGKTVAFAIPMLKGMRPPGGGVQVVTIAPSRELARQIGDVIRSIAAGYKVTCCYGGHDFEDEKNSLSVAPDILVGTPGRLLDHVKRGDVDLRRVRMLVLDEFDKSLELGFQDEMERVVKRMPNVSRRILTSATPLSEYPDFIRMENAKTFDFLGTNRVERRLEVLQVESDQKDKLEALLSLVRSLDGGKAIVFVNYRDAVERVYGFLASRGLPAGLYHGGMEQIDREKAVAMLNNGTFKVVVTTDLGSRGLDLADIRHIVHYHLPVTEEVYVHRNGRTARVDATGCVYVITAPDEKVASYIRFDGKMRPEAPEGGCEMVKDTETLFFSAGKKEKISRSDILGFLIAKGGLSPDEIGKIDVADHYAMVAVPSDRALPVLGAVAKEKIKGRKVRISIARPLGAGDRPV